MVDVELRQAPLLTESIRWCSNLAGPDMLYDWSWFMPDWVNNGVGMFGLGPYFNLLPILTIVLFLWQQKKMMPPPTDENAAMQQKIMKYMMVFMGILFYKVAAGLCVYFIASSLWGMAEREFLPKFSHAGATPPPPEAATARRRR
jgi:YidC/Oxa1 family membrane protein insertase